ncbi:MAG: hypothetical protein U9N85_01160 [Bacteroidota bacterium]|nr:hypothetical protein [Bacteroidota bacterium]
MKLTAIYNHIKTLLQDIEDLKLITWYNGQNADNILHTVPAAFIEFPNTQNTQTQGGGRAQQFELTIRINLVSKLLTLNDGSINTEIMEVHEELAMKIYEALQQAHKELDAGGIGFNQMVRTDFELNMSQPGTAMTTQNFKCLVYQAARSSQSEVTASPNINMQ